MKTTLRLLSCIVVGSILAVLPASSGPLALRHAHSGATVTGIPVSLPLSFEANRGQVDSQVHYVARGPGYTVFLTDREAVLSLKPGADNSEPSISEAGRGRSRLSSGDVVRIQPVGAKRHADVQALDQLPGISNYFMGSDPAKWRTGIPTYGKVKYEGIYPGVDLVYYGNQRQLEFDFVVAPGADPSTIKLAFQGIDDLEVGPKGDLVLKIGSKEVWLQKPVVYQVMENSKRMIPGEYVVKGKGQVGFMVAAYDTSKPLVIDPALVFSTYLGGGGEDSANGIFVDGSGIYLTGSTTSDLPNPFPTTSSAHQTSYGGAGDAFVTKINASGTALVYSTYLGGSSADVGNGIFVDGSLQAYVTGSTQSSGTIGGFPTTAGAYQRTFGGTTDAFVTKLSIDGTTLVYSTYLGGADEDVGNSIFVAGPAGSENAYVTGSTKSSPTTNGFPATAGAYQTTFSGTTDAFVTKLTVAGNGLVYSTYLGGSSADVGNGIFVDGSLQAYVTGSTESSPTVNGFPATPGAFQTTFGGTTDAFVTKLNGAGTALLYSTYLGGASEDVGNSIFVDGSGDAYLTGSTTSDAPNPFPTTFSAFSKTYGGSGDAFVTKLSPARLGLADLVYSTYLGGSGQDSGNSIYVDASLNAYVTGSTTSDSPNPFPTTFGASSYGGSGDAFVTKINATATALIYSTYLGGRNTDVGKAISVDGAGDAYVAGSTNSPDFPLRDPLVGNTTLGGGTGSSTDAFVAKITAAGTMPSTGTSVSDSGSGGGGGCFIATAAAPSRASDR